MKLPDKDGRGDVVRRMMRALEAMGLKGAMPFQMPPGHALVMTPDGLKCLPVGGKGPTGHGAVLADIRLRDGRRVRHAYIPSPDENPWNLMGTWDDGKPMEAYQIAIAVAENPPPFIVPRSVQKLFDKVNPAPAEVQKPLVEMMTDGSWIIWARYENRDDSVLDTYGRTLARSLCCMRADLVSAAITRCCAYLALGPQP